MRKHIYKAWSKEKNKWLTLDDRLIIVDEEDYWHKWVTGMDSSGMIFLFQDMGAELVQYIGLKDRNNIMIFEEDIVKGYDRLNLIGFYGVVRFENASFCIVDEACSYYRWQDYDIEIIGNSLENPKMLSQLEGN